VGAVPLIGEDQTRLPRLDRNRSGDALATCNRCAGSRTTAEKGAGFPEASAAPSAATSQGVVPAPEPSLIVNGADIRRVRFTW